MRTSAGVHGDKLAALPAVQQALGEPAEVDTDLDAAAGEAARVQEP